MKKYIFVFLGTKSIKNTKAQSVGESTRILSGAGMPPKDNHDTYPQGARPKESSGIQLTCVVLLL